LKNQRQQTAGRPTTLLTKVARKQNKSLNIKLNLNWFLISKSF